MDHAAAAQRAAEGQRNAAARRLAELGAAARSAKAETDRLGESREAEAARDGTWPALAELEERLRLAEATPVDAEPSTEERDRLAALVPQARQNEMEVRLAVRTAEERVARSPAGPTRWCARPPPSGPPGSGPRPAGPRARGAAIARAVAGGARRR